MNSLNYRRALVLYIDHNPVQAGTVDSPAAYAWGSARYYAEQKGPAWLSRGWVEGECMRGSNSNIYSASSDVRTFGVSGKDQRTELSDWMEARESARMQCHEPDDLIGSAPIQVQRWMQRKAKLADGAQVGLPVCSRLSLLASIDLHQAASGKWWVESEGKVWNGYDLARVGALHEFCCLSWQGIADTECMKLSLVRKLGAVHSGLVHHDSEYSIRVAALAHQAMARCLS